MIMSDRPVGLLVVAAIVAPMCVLCLAGPALIAVFAGSVAAWFSGTNALILVGAVAAMAILAWRFYGRRASSNDTSSNVETRRS